MRSIALDGVRKRGDNRAPAHQAMLDTAYGTAARKAFQEHFGSDKPKAKKVIRTEFKPGSATRVFYVMYHEVGYGKPTYKWIEEDAMLAMEGNILEEFMAVCAFNDNDNNDLIATFHLIPSWHTYTMSDAMHEVPGQEYFSQTVLTRYVTLARPGEGRYRAPMPKKCPQCAREQPMCTQNVWRGHMHMVLRDARARASEKF